VQHPGHAAPPPRAISLGRRAKFLFLTGSANRQVDELPAAGSSNL
jgi:hypothetical protein